MPEPPISVMNDVMEVRYEVERGMSNWITNFRIQDSIFTVRY